MKINYFCYIQFQIKLNSDCKYIQYFTQSIFLHNLNFEGIYIKLNKNVSYKNIE